MPDVQNRNSSTESIDVNGRARQCNSKIRFGRENVLLKRLWVLKGYHVYLLVEQKPKSQQSFAQGRYLAMQIRDNVFEHRSILQSARLNPQRDHNRIHMAMFSSLATPRYLSRACQCLQYYTWLVLRQTVRTEGPA